MRYFVLWRCARPDLPDGEITETEVFPLRALVREPMNLALYDAEVFATAVHDFTRDGDDAGLRGYSGTCLARTWKYQEWSHWMAEMLCGACPENASPAAAGQGPA
jgi:p-hydroxybenzoate 3-monooxygenase